MLSVANTMIFLGFCIAYCDDDDDDDDDADIGGRREPV
jgi:hypothetical protein